ncbi:Cof-type HAD-IIB family hydrolase [Lactiplantibacillus fabifermentans]|uniref:Cof family hydrolase n=2 Tax=Lactiplantibacillus fabifermentans TaxID=483011 RepID=A0A0R2NE38_9LACO|nr:Cof-type HAD-IIB family hydrolase [Lactiplantibacillus fabifermentans]ETY73590.1 HAD family hydrolase [Lactiplantibacillus fabifermentans T30PCM01]KRO24101.1 cof family hydrolase [Lactiplantibacillus fabifermentans DSM 21115]
MVAKLAVFDIDDTLLARNKQFLPSTLASIKQLKQQGIHVAIATGRNMAMARKVITALDLKDYVLCNGSAAFADQQQVHRHTLSKENVAKLVQAADEQQVDIVLESLDGLHTHTHPSQKTRDVLTTFKAPALTYDPDFYKNEPVYQAMMFYDESQAASLPHPDEFSFVRFHDYGVDVIPKVGSKAQGIAKLAANLQVAPENVVAFGDGQNDREMLKSAGVGIAMGNAADNVKAMADLTTTDCDHDGIENGLKMVGWL